jgi:hypothetical protein
VLGLEINEGMAGFLIGEKGEKGEGTLNPAILSCFLKFSAEVTFKSFHQF